MMSLIRGRSYLFVVIGMICTAGTVWREHVSSPSFRGIVRRVTHRDSSDRCSPGEYYNEGEFNMLN